MEIIKNKRHYCPQCGKKRGVTLRKIEYRPDKADTKVETHYFICCKNCKIRYAILNLGIWDE